MHRTRLAALIIAMTLLFGTATLFAMAMIVFAFSVGLSVAQAIAENLAQPDAPSAVAEGSGS